MSVPVVRVALLLCAASLTAEAARVLMLTPIGGKSQKNVFYGLGKALSQRGHEVVLFSAFKPSSPVPGVKEVVPEGLAALFTDEKWPSQFKMQRKGMGAGFSHFRELFAESPRAAVFSKELDQLLEEKFDLVVIGAFSYSVYFVPYKLNAPFILLSPLGYFPLLSSPMGNPTLPSVSPMFVLDASEHMTFFERVKSTVGHLLMNFLFRLIFIPYCDRVVAEKYGEGTFPPAAEIEKNASMLFLSGTEVTDYHQPLLPNTIQVGGTHCEEVEPLPDHLRQFLGDSEFIFFSLGSVARPEDMTEEERSAIVNGLAVVPYKVLLKWDTTDRTGMPDNILPAKWLPQQDILGNSKCRLFISHGGYASVLESLCHGVPTLIMPVTGDQFYNAANVRRMGASKTLHWEDLTAETLVRNVQEAATPDVLEAARYRKHLLETRPIPSRDLAVYWAEHVISHGGAPHLRSVAVDLHWFQYYSLDVILFLLLVLLVVAKVMMMILRCCCRCLCGSKRTSADAAATGSKAKKRTKKD